MFDIQKNICRTSAIYIPILMIEISLCRPIFIYRQFSQLQRQLLWIFVKHSTSAGLCKRTIDQIVRLFTLICQFRYICEKSAWLWKAIPRLVRYGMESCHRLDSAYYQTRRTTWFLYATQSNSCHTTKTYLGAQRTQCIGLGVGHRKIVSNGSARAAWTIFACQSQIPLRRRGNFVFTMFGLKCLKSFSFY